MMMNNSGGDCEELKENVRIGGYNLRPRRGSFNYNVRRFLEPRQKQQQQHHQQKINLYHAGKGDVGHHHVRGGAGGVTQRVVSSHNLKCQEKKDDFEHLMPLLLRDKGYEVRGGIKIGEGRYSKVITAKLIDCNETVAIKLIDRSKVATDFREKFLPREMAIWGKIRHRNLVGLYAIYAYKEHVLLVNEYGKMGNLLSWVMRNGPTDEGKGHAWAVQVLLAMKYLHEKRIAHRDLKLENIVVFDENTIKIADFGFSRQFEDVDLSTTYCGSKAYSAPEVLSGTPYNPFKSDVWSMGVVFYVMMTNRMPFSETMSNSKVISCQKNRSYVFPPRLIISEECKRTIDTLLTFRPVRRPDIKHCLTLPWFWKN